MGNSVIKGLINIDGIRDRNKIDNTKQTILIESNQFIQNFAYFSTVGVQIRKYDPLFSSYSYLDYSYLPCGGIIVNQNLFQNNFGCPLFGGSLI